MTSTASSNNQQQQLQQQQQQNKPLPAPRTGSLRDISSFSFPKGSILGSSVDKTESRTSITGVSDAKTALSSVYSTGKESTRPSTKPNDFASLHSSIYAATKQRSALNTGQSVPTVSTNDLRGQSSVEARGQSYEPSRVLTSSIYSSGMSTSQSSFESSAGQSDISQGSDQSSIVPDPQNAIFQSTRSIIGIGHSPQSFQTVYASSTSRGAQPDRTLSNDSTGLDSRSIPISSAPFIETKDYSQRGSAPNRGQAHSQGLLKTSNQKPSSSLVETLTNPFARQYPRPSVPTVVPDINDNDVPIKQQNGGVYQNSSSLLSRRGSSGFHGIGGWYCLYINAILYIYMYIFIFSNI